MKLVAKVLASLFALTAVVSTAHAQSAVDVADLPPLPPADEELSSSATVLAAANSEEDVVVGAAKRQQSLGNVASAVTVITADRIRRFGYRTVTEAIAAVAGVYIQDTRLTQQVGIRGLQIPGGFNSRILVLVDGATVNEAWGAFAGVGYDGIVSIDDISRIEVIRGPVGAVYGTNAFFGIINIVTRGAVEGSRAWGRVAINSINGAVGTAGFAAGSLDKQVRGTVLAMERFGESSSVSEISGSPLESDGARTFIASVIGQYKGSFAQLRAYQARRDSPFAPYDSDPTLDPAYELYNRQLLLEGGHTRELSKRLTASVRAYGNLYRYSDRIHNVDDVGDPEVYADIGDAITFGAEIRGRYELAKDKLGITAGTEANYNKTESRAHYEGMETAPDAVKIPLDFNIQGVYTELDSQPTEWLGFTAGLRYDRNSVFDNRLSPRGALFLAKPEKYGLKLLYAEGFRNPSAFESYFQDNVDFVANRDIRAETIRSFETVLWARPVTGLSTRVSAFYWKANDVIEQGPSPEDATLLQFQNTGDYLTQGVELEGSYRNAAGWYAFGGLAYAKTGSSDGDAEVELGNVANAPKLTGSGGISTPLLFNKAHFSMQGTFVGERLTRFDENGVRGPASPAWFGLDATLFAPNLGGFDVTAGVRNILGKRDLQPAVGDYDRFPEGEPSVFVPRLPAEGRELYVKVGYSY
ncbi:MAG: TonB-dependent receptor [Kofleriaceae bacterium]|nr:TonB-dependent receptor [Kofleriaceae bacterium]